MATTYTAWNGDEYPWPPPEGWEEKSDGRYWPADRGPTEPSTPAAAPPPDNFGAVPPPRPTPPPTPGTMPPPGAMPPPGGMPPPGAMPPPGGMQPGAVPPQQWAGGYPGGQAPAPVKGSNRNTFIVLGIIFGVLVLMVGGCIVALATLGDEIVDTIETFGEETQEAIDGVTFEQCGVIDGQLVAAGNIENRRDVTTSYDFSIVFVEPDGTRSKVVNTEVNNLREGESDLFRVVYGSAEDVDYRCEVNSMFLEPFAFSD